MLTMQCLDLTPNADGVHNDPHGLKPNLRRGDFVLAGPHTDVQPIMPWQQILRELVGYTKYVQSLVPLQPAFHALAEMSRLCALDSVRLRAELHDLEHTRNDQMVSLLKESEIVSLVETQEQDITAQVTMLQQNMQALRVADAAVAPPPPHANHARLPRLLSRMQAVIKT